MCATVGFGLDMTLIDSRSLPPNAELVPGAAGAIAAVRARGGRVVVFTDAPDAALHLSQLGVAVGDRIGPVLRHGMQVYVGDHGADVKHARAAGVVAVAVATGGDSAAQLSQHGADVVLSDLTEFPAWFHEHVRRDRVASLQDRLAALGSVLVAFSGGADSAFLLAAAVRVLGPGRVVAATAVSPSLPATELAGAERYAATLGVRHLRPGTEELSRAGYRANGGDRCYFCKSELIEALLPLAAESGSACVVTGTNADDLVAGFRPGIRAAAERGAVTPLADAGLSKDDVRRTSRDWGLSTWDKPAAACLASRIAYGIEVTPARLAGVERSETLLRAALTAAGHPVRDLRVRLLGAAAIRVEVDADLVERVRADQGLRALLPDASSIQVEVFRSGSLNDALAAPAIP